MNFDSNDKKYAKNFLTAFLSLQGIVAFFIMGMFVFVAIFFVKEWNKSNERFDRGVAAFHESKKDFFESHDKRFKEAREELIRPGQIDKNNE